MEAKLVDINEWEQFGGGGNGLAYYHKTDPTLVLKLNKKELPREAAEQDYRISKAVYDMGIECPAVYDFVTDGERYGVIVERIRDKKSFARMMGDDPSMTDELARSFAEHSKKFHSTLCDKAVFGDYAERVHSQISASPDIPDDVKSVVLGYVDSMLGPSFCIHGDFQPGNMIRSSGRDYWIDLGEFVSGDPDFDMASMLLLSKYTPAKVVEYLFHVTRKQFAHFVELYGKYYYGDRWHSPDLDEKLRKVLMIKMALSIVKSPKSASIFLPALRGQKFRTWLIMRIADLTIKTYN